MSELSRTILAPAAIEEFHADGDHPFGLDDVLGRERPLVIRGLVRDWPIVKLAQQSDPAFAQRLAELDNGADVSTLRIAPERMASSATRRTWPISATSTSRCW